jgi:hypothetical protein
MAMDQLEVAGEIGDSLTTVLATVSTIGTLQTASPLILSTLITVMGDSLAAINAAISQLDTEIITDSVAGMVAGTPAPDLWPVLVAQANDSRQMALFLNVRAYAGRAQTNTAMSPG